MVLEVSDADEPESEREWGCCSREREGELREQKG